MLVLTEHRFNLYGTEINRLFYFYKNLSAFYRSKRIILGVERASLSSMSSTRKVDDEKYKRFSNGQHALGYALVRSA